MSVPDSPPRRFRWRRVLLGGLGVLLLIVAIGAWSAGSLLMARSGGPIKKPVGLFAEDVQFESAAGDTIRGWWMPRPPSSPCLLFVHGINADRLAMLDRARLFSHLGYSTLLFDLPAHGESSGRSVTFGGRESAAVSGALGWVRARVPGSKVGVDGLSLGGAAVLLRREHTGFDAIVVEAVFPTIHRAILNRMTDRFGLLGYAAEPLLEIQLILRLQEWPGDLAPVEQIDKVGAPVLVIGGEDDHLTPVGETRELYRRAREPKQLWIVPGAGLADFLRAQPAEYARTVGGFFATHLRSK